MAVEWLCICSNNSSYCRQ